MESYRLKGLFSKVGRSSSLKRLGARNSGDRPKAGPAGRRLGVDNLKVLFFSSGEVLCFA